MSIKCGLLGRQLGHSYSPTLHALLGSYEYRLYEKQPEELEEFLTGGDFTGLNVTIPYKRAVLPYCARLSPAAAAIGSVNTLVRLPEGGLLGDNTDADGFRALVRRSGFSPAGEKALILGSGGAMLSLRYVLEELGARVTVISRSGADNYENLYRHEDAALVVNATPLGTYPHNGRAALDLRALPKCRCVLDIVYNPARTALLMQAESLGIPCLGGMYMLAEQARRSSELFTGAAIAPGETDRVVRTLSQSTENLALIGMPGCGKTRVGMALAELLGRPFADADGETERRAAMDIPEIFRRWGEEGFRRLETETLSELGKRSGIVISTGGGCVTRPENYPLLHQNSRLIWLRRPLDTLAREGRPLSQRSEPLRMYREREPLYRQFADYIIDNEGAPEDTARRIAEALNEAADN